MDTTVVWSGIPLTISAGFVGRNICWQFLYVSSGVSLCGHVSVNQEEMLVIIIARVKSYTDKLISGHVITIIGVSLSEPHHMRSTVKYVFMLACLIRHPLYGWKPFKCKPTLYQTHEVLTISFSPQHMIRTICCIIASLALSVVSFYQTFSQQYFNSLSTIS